MKTLLWIMMFLAFVPSAGARGPIYSDYDKVRKAELIFFGEVVAFGRDTGCLIQVERVYKGSASAGSFAFPFVESYLGSVVSPAVSLRRGDKAYFFLFRNVQGEYELLGNSQGVYLAGDNDVLVYDDLIRDLVSYAETLQSSILRGMMNKGSRSRRAALGAVLTHAPLLKMDSVIADGVMSCLMDSDPLVRRDAVWLIRQLGISGGASVLRRHQNDPDESVRQTVEIVLRKMRANKDDAESVGNVGPEVGPDQQKR